MDHLITEQIPDATECFKFCSKEQELDRTAEMVVDLSERGLIEFAIWLIYDSNRFDAASMKFLAERVQAQAQRKRET